MNPIIVALDVESGDEARALVKRLGSAIDFYKVGMELYAAAGMEIVRELCGQGKQVFLDLKMYDIPETVKRAVRVISKSGARFLTIHASRAVMQAATEGKQGSALQLLAVTVLTSFDRSDLDDYGFTREPSDLVQFLTRKAVETGVEGIVTSPLECAAVRRIARDAIIVTPGVRSRGTTPGDQKRVATPAEAIAAGANYLVIGRQITRAPDPAAEARRVLAELA